MNSLIGTIKKIEQSGAIVLVDIVVHGQIFSALLIESEARPSWLKESNTVMLLFKETEVSLAKNLSGLINLRNRMHCNVIQVVRGELLSKVTMQFKDYILSSAITTRSVDLLSIKVGDPIDALVKSNEIILKKNN